MYLLLLQLIQYPKHFILNCSCRAIIVAYDDRKAQLTTIGGMVACIGLYVVYAATFHMHIIVNG
jgi:hypothetical protein